MICYMKIQSENMKMTWNISFISIWYDFNFFKCDGFSYNFVNNIYQIVWYLVYYLFFAAIVI